MATKIQLCDYLAARENYKGWCPECQEFTRDMTEPDAEGYDCPVCGGNTVIGAEDAMMGGLFEFSEED